VNTHHTSIEQPKFSELTYRILNAFSQKKARLFRMHIVFRSVCLQSDIGILF
jgi:hypothetical protein